MDVFVPHEEIVAGAATTAETVFAIDYAGVANANAVVALLDGPVIDDGTACEIGVFYGLMQHDPSKKGIVGLLTDLRATRNYDAGAGYGLNLFVLGCIAAAGSVTTSIDEALAVLEGWRGELRPAPMLRHVDRAARGEPVGALVFFHGYFGIPEDFVAFVDKIDPERRFHGYLPQGPYPVADGRASWFDQDSTESPETQLAPVAEWLDALRDPPERTVLGGWSQGANVAYTLALAAGRPRPAGILALGGGFRDEIAPDLARPLPPIAIAHGRADDVVPVDVARHVRDRLEEAGASVVYRETDIGHEIDQAVVPALRAFLAKLP